MIMSPKIGMAIGAIRPKPRPLWQARGADAPTNEQSNVVAFVAESSEIPPPTWLIRCKAPRRILLDFWNELVADEIDFVSISGNKTNIE